MSEQCYTITPMDHLSLRDGRPFDSSGGRMKGLDWPLPSTLAGALRTRLATRKACGGNPFTSEIIEALKKVHLKGPLPLMGEREEASLCFPRPLDILVREEDNKAKDIYPLCPKEIQPGEGTLLDDDLLPLFPQGLSNQDSFKPMKLAPLWTCEMMEQWLANEPQLQESGGLFKNPLKALPSDNRTHVRIDSSRRAHHDGVVFNTSHLHFLAGSVTEGFTQMRLACSIDQAGSFQEALALMEGTGTLGGGRRPVRYEAASSPRGWRVPETIKKALAGRCSLRVVLATPAIFSEGWKPGWLADGGALPDFDPSLTFTLVAAAVNRWQPLTGWSYEHPVGSKAIRRMAPAGSVYFVKASRPLTEQDVESLWLRSVCDDTQDRRDGFGLALWGLWKKD